MHTIQEYFSIKNRTLRKMDFSAKKAHVWENPLATALRSHVGTFCQKGPQLSHFAVTGTIKRDFGLFGVIQRRSNKVMVVFQLMAIMGSHFGQPSRDQGQTSNVVVTETQAGLLVIMGNSTSRLTWSRSHFDRRPSLAAILEERSKVTVCCNWGNQTGLRANIGNSTGLKETFC